MIVRLFLLLFALHTASAAGEGAVVFDGGTLDGWRVQGAPCWKVIDGELVGRSDPAKKNSILWTKRKFRDFSVEVDYRISDGADSGVFLRHLNEQIQLGTSVSQKRDLTGSPYIGSKRGYPAEATGAADVLRPDDWNRMRIEVRGDRYQVWINGVSVLDYTSDTAREKGPVGLQVHPGLEMEIRFREVRIEALDE